MKLINKYFVLEVKDEKVYYNLKEVSFDSYKELYDKLYIYIKRKNIDELHLEGDFEPLTNVEQIVILVLSNFYMNVYSDKYNKYLDISYSYNFPIYKQKWIIDKLLKIGKKALDTNMIVFADSIDYIVKDVSNNNEYNNFLKKYGYYINRGDRIFETKNCDLSYTLNYWNDYCNTKHNKRFSADAINVYEDIYSNLGFNSIKVIKDNVTVVTTAYFKDDINKIIYFLITGWNEDYKKYSPCIYLYSKGIEYCHNNGYKFSFCYGQQTYKNNLLKYFADNHE